MWLDAFNYKKILLKSALCALCIPSSATSNILGRNMKGCWHCFMVNGLQTNQGSRCSTMKFTIQLYITIHGLDVDWFWLIYFSDHLKVTKTKIFGQLIVSILKRHHRIVAWLYLAFKRGSIITKRICSQLSKSNSFSSVNLEIELNLEVELEEIFWKNY